MMITKYITVCFLFFGLAKVISQNDVCANSSDGLLEDLNAIGKCAIDNFKTSQSKEFIKVSSRNRYVRKNNNSHLNKLKEHLKTVPKKERVVNTIAVEEKTIMAVDKKDQVAKVVSGNSNNNQLVIKDFLRFDQVGVAPIFISCNSTGSNDDKEECNKETIIGVLLENLVYPFDAAAEGVEGVVWVRFIIDKDGYVKNITAKGPENGAELEKEAKRLVNLLPKFLPGKHQNEYVSVEYFVPIEFHLD